MRGFITLSAILIAFTTLTSAHETKSVDMPDAEQSILQMIEVEVKVIKLPTNRMKDIGLDVQLAKEKGVDRIEATQVPDRLADLPAEFVDALLKNGVGSVITDAKMVTVAGREASISIGSQVNASSAETEIKVVPTLLSDQRVNLDLFITWALHSAAEVSEKAKVGIRTYSLDTTVASQPDKSTVLTGLRCQENGAEQNFVVIVTPRLIERIAAAK